MSPDSFAFALDGYDLTTQTDLTNWNIDSNQFGHPIFDLSGIESGKIKVEYKAIDKTACKATFHVGHPRTVEQYRDHMQRRFVHFETRNDFSPVRNVADLTDTEKDAVKDAPWFVPKENEIVDHFTEGGAISEAETHCEAVTVTIDPNDPPPFTKSFLESLRDLQNSGNPEREYNRFTERYGSHFGAVTTLGVLNYAQAKYSLAKRSKSTIVKMDQCARAYLQGGQITLTLEGGQISSECPTFVQGEKGKFNKTIDGETSDQLIVLKTGLSMTVNLLNDESFARMQEQAKTLETPFELDQKKLVNLMLRMYGKSCDVLVSLLMFYCGTNYFDFYSRLLV